MREGRGRLALRIILLAAVYFAAGKAGLLLPIVQGNITLLWAPSGIALAAVLAFGPGVWPGIALGAFLVNWSTGAPLAAYLGIAVGNTLEALAGGGLLLRSGFEPSLRRGRDVLALLAFGVAVGPLFGAAFGVSSLVATGLLPAEKAFTAGAYWWLGDAAGILLVTPVLLTWRTLPRRPWPGARVLEAAALGFCLVAASVLMLSFWIGSGIPHPPLSSILFPFLVWAALRFGPRGAATATLAAMGIAIWATVNGLTPFIQGTMEERLIYLHSYMAIAAVTSLLLAAIFAERRRAEDEIRASEERLRLALDAGRCGVWDWEIQSGRLTWSERVFEIHGVSREGFRGRFEDFNRLV
ncbi:MAG TPA: MASE1 domain-containing protein, partial [Thermoanaerobaculia bacterium]|nr:MASE1 domain-containing protein [Thermoanaerobaculia bacterium]